MGKLRQKMVLVTMSKVIWPFFYLMVGLGMTEGREVWLEGVGRAEKSGRAGPAKVAALAFVALSLCPVAWHALEG